MKNYITRKKFNKTPSWDQDYTHIRNRNKDGVLSHFTLSGLEDKVKLVVAICATKAKKLSRVVDQIVNEASIKRIFFELI